jgi:hypothetical protein
MVDERRPIPTFHVKQFLSPPCAGDMAGISDRLIFLKFRMRGPHDGAVHARTSINPRSRAWPSRAIHGAAAGAMLGDMREAQMLLHLSPRAMQFFALILRNSRRLRREGGGGPMVRDGASRLLTMRPRKGSPRLELAPCGWHAAVVG